MRLYIDLNGVEINLLQPVLRNKDPGPWNKSGQIEVRCRWYLQYLCVTFGFPTSLARFNITVITYLSVTFLFLTVWLGSRGRHCQLIRRSGQTEISQQLFDAVTRGTAVHTFTVQRVLRIY